jgi:hypothetical protein
VNHTLLNLPRPPIERNVTLGAPHLVTALSFKDSSSAIGTVSARLLHLFHRLAVVFFAFMIVIFDILAFVANGCIAHTTFVTA